MSSKTHIAIAVTAENTLGKVDIPTRSPEADEVVIQTHFASYGAFDGHQVYDAFFIYGYPALIGLGATGEIVEVGSNVDWLKKGDIVGAITQPGSDRGLQQFIAVPANRVVKIPDGVKQEDVASLMDNFVCAWWTIKTCFGLPLPDTLPSDYHVPTGTASQPILIWGGGTSAAIHTIQVLKFAGYTNIITTASSRTAADAFDFGATHVFDYRDPEVAQKIKSVAGSEPIKYALNPVCTKDSLEQIAKVVTEPGSKVGLLLPIKVGDVDTFSKGGVTLATALPDDMNPFGVGVEPVGISTFGWEADPVLKTNLMRYVLPELLASKRVRSQKVHVLSEGSLLERVQQAADLVQTNKLGGAKAVVSFKE